MDGETTTASRVTIGVPRETVPNERRVSLIPDTVAKLTGSGATVLVETGAGEGAFFSDAAYEGAGATIVPDAATLYEQSDLVVKVQAPIHDAEEGIDEVGLLRSGMTLIAFLGPLNNPELVQLLADQGVTAFSMDAIPRITRAQSMDALSSMSTIAGYKAVIMAANSLPKFFPLLMTAAGTIAPAKALIVGAGVAGLQAIATARRLGAVVEAYDTRPVVKEQVESLGAKFVEIDTGESDTQDAGGYAKQASEDVLRKQAEVLAQRAAQADFVITTALVPGRAAPRLIRAETVAEMRPGSVIIDLAAEAGGNCELTEPGEAVVSNGVTILGPLNIASTMPVHASQMYAKNLQNLLALLVHEGTLSPDFNDEIVSGTCVARDGEVTHGPTRERLSLGTPRAAAEPAVETVEPEEAETAATVPGEPSAPRDADTTIDREPVPETYRSTSG